MNTSRLFKNATLRRNKMLKKSTLLAVSIFVLLFIGLSDYGYGDHKKNPNAGHGGGDEEGLYSVMTLLGPIDNFAVDSFNYWEEHKGGQSIGLGSFDDIIGELDLSFFRVFGGPFFEDRGEFCFGSASGRLDPQAGFRKFKGGSVLGQLWFRGCTDEGIDSDSLTGECKTEILYELDLVGPSIPDNWPPAENETSTVIIKSWELFGGNNSHSCAGGEDFASDVAIEVTRENWRCPVRC